MIAEELIPPENGNGQRQEKVDHAQPRKEDIEKTEGEVKNRPNPQVVVPSFSYLRPLFHLNTAPRAEIRALPAAYVAFGFHNGITAAIHLDCPQRTDVFTHAAGGAPLLIHSGHTF